MKWPIIYTFLATFLVMLGLIEKKPIYLLTAFFIYIITIIWLLRKKSNPQFPLLELEEKKAP